MREIDREKEREREKKKGRARQRQRQRYRGKKETGTQLYNYAERTFLMKLHFKAKRLYVKSIVVFHS